MDMNLDHLTQSEQRTLATRWGAPSASPHALAQFLASPLQIQRRLEAASAQAGEDLVGLLEATTPSVPFDSLRQAAVEELAALLLVNVSTQEPLRVVLPLPVALATLDVLPATPCRLRLLLHGLDPLGLQRMHRAVCPTSLTDSAPQDKRGHGGALKSRPRQVTLFSADMPAAICAALTSASHLEALLDRLGTDTARALWHLIAQSGLRTLRAAQEASEQEQAHLDALIAHGLLWRTSRDLRVPVEVLQELLLLRLRRQVHRAAARCTALSTRAPEDNVRAFPGATGRWLGHAAERLSHLTRAEPLDEAAMAWLIGSEEPTTLARRRQLMMAAELVEPLAPHWAVGPLTFIEQWDQARPENLGEVAAQRLVERVTLGEPWSGVSEAARQMFGPDAVEPEPFDNDDDAYEGICAVAPHMMDAEEALCFPPGAQASAQRLLRSRLQGLLASMSEGQVFGIDELQEVCASLVGVAHTHQRLIGYAYARDLREALPEQRRQAVMQWLQALAMTMGWLRVEELDDAERPTDSPSSSEALPLFASLSPPTPSPATIDEMVAGEGVRRVRVMSLTLPDVTPATAGLEALGTSHLEALAPLWRRSPLAITPPDTDAAPRLPPREASLREQLRSFGEVAPPGELELVELLRDYAMGQTAARRLQDLRHDDVERFLVCWLRLDVRTRDLGRLRRLFAGLEHLACWARHHEIAMAVDVMALRGRLEGRILRTCSAEAAFTRHQSPVPPPDLLRLRPEAAYDGLAQVVDVDVGRRTLQVEGVPRRHGDLWTVRTSPEPLRLLQIGDLIDSQLIRYGELCWMGRLRRILVSEAGKYL